MREAVPRCALRLRHARRGRSRRHVRGRRLRRPPRRRCGTGRCGDVPGLGHGRPFGPRPLRELSRFRCEADRECRPARLRTRAAGHLLGVVAEHLGPCVHGPGGTVGARSVATRPRALLTRAGAHHQFRRDERLPGRRRRELPGHPRGAHQAARRHHRVGDVGPAVIGRDEDATASGHLHPHHRRERAGPRAPRPRGAGRPGPTPAPGPGPGSGLATGSAPEPVSRALAHPVGSHRVRGLPGRPGDPERHRPGSCGALARAAPLHGAPRQHRPNRVRTFGGPDRGGFQTLERRALRHPRRRRLRPQGCRRLPRTRRLLHVPSDRTGPPRTGPDGDGHRDLVQVRAPAHHRRLATVAPGTSGVVPPHRLGAGLLGSPRQRAVLHRCAGRRVQPPVRPPQSPRSPRFPRFPPSPPRADSTPACPSGPGPAPDQARYNRGPVPWPRGDHH